MKLVHRVALIAGLVLVGCKIEHKPFDVAQPASAADPPAGSFQRKGFDPQRDVAAMWSSKVLPSLQARALDHVQLREAMQRNLDAAGARHGYRERGEGAPWNFATVVKGKIVEVDTESSAGKAMVDVDADGKHDVVLQIGPVLRGTSVRDSLDFISFTNYTNQIDFAQLANAFNQQAFETAIKALPRDQLVGKQIELLGTFTWADDGEPPLVTPVQIKRGGAL